MEEKKIKENEYFPFSMPMGNCNVNNVNEEINKLNKSDNDLAMPWQEMPKNRNHNGKNN